MHPWQVSSQASGGGNILWWPHHGISPNLIDLDFELYTFHRYGPKARGMDCSAVIRTYKTSELQNEEVWSRPTARRSTQVAWKLSGSLDRPLCGASKAQKRLATVQETATEPESSQELVAKIGTRVTFLWFCGVSWAIGLPPVLIYFHLRYWRCSVK